MKTATILFGNSHNKLDQVRWSQFCHAVIKFVFAFNFEVHFIGYTNPNTIYQTCSITFCFEGDFENIIKGGLSEFAREFKQDSIALIIGETQFVSPLK